MKIRQEIITILRALQQMAIDLNPGVEVVLHGGLCSPVIAIKLHNKGIRPTVYSLQIKVDRYGNFGVAVLDTIVRENKSHISKKQTFPTLEKAVEYLPSFFMQFCDGSLEETLSNYAPYGLLYISK